jgi:hypothetical protein
MNVSQSRYPIVERGVVILCRLSTDDDTKLKPHSISNQAPRGPIAVELQRNESVKATEFMFRDELKSSAATHLNDQTGIDLATPNPV